MSEIIQLPESFNIGTIFDVNEEIKKIISEHDEITLDFGNVQAIDILGIQLIVCVVKAILNNNLKLNLINVNSQLQRYFSYASLPLSENITISKNDVGKFSYLNDN